CAVRDLATAPPCLLACRGLPRPPPSSPPFPYTTLFRSRQCARILHRTTRDQHGTLCGNLTRLQLHRSPAIHRGHDYLGHRRPVRRRLDRGTAGLASTEL